MKKYDAFIVAGGKSPWLQEVCQTTYTCLAPLGRRRIIDYIISALHDSGRIRKIVIATDEPVIAALRGTLPDFVSTIRGGEDLLGTAIAAADALRQDEDAMLLGVCDDIPMLRAEDVADFLAQCEATPGYELYYPIIPREACLAQFPTAKRTYGHASDGCFTGGNMMFVASGAIHRTADKARQVVALRKSPFQLARWLGWSFIMKALFRQLSVDTAGERFSAIMGMRSKAIITTHAAIGMDIDKMSDYRLAQNYFSKISNGGGNL